VKLFDEAPTPGPRVPLDELAARARDVKVVAFDVDGVLTDGRLYYGPDGELMHAFQARDGLGMVRARLAGLVLVAVTGRVSKNVDARLRELKVQHVVQGARQKDEELQAVLDKEGASFAQAAFVGDDVNDVCCFAKVRLAACVPDSADDVAPHVHYVTRRKGGEGALREVIELVLKAQGRW
jgi:3-deoxy-D-manno-octulosonate 8-phosphate phosphatase (KDO 8-P phosphatase)